MTQQRARKGWGGPQVTSSAGSLHVVESGTAYFPIRVADEATLFTTPASPDTSADEHRTTRYNLTAAAKAYLREVGSEQPRAIFFHALAIMASPAYGAEHGDALARDWARIPLPSDLDRLKISAEIDAAIAALLDLECPAERPGARYVPRPSRLSRAAVVVKSVPEQAIWP